MEIIWKSWKFWKLEKFLKYGKSFKFWKNNGNLEIVVKFLQLLLFEVWFASCELEKCIAIRIFLWKNELTSVIQLCSVEHHIQPEVHASLDRLHTINRCVTWQAPHLAVWPENQFVATRYFFRFVMVLFHTTG